MNKILFILFMIVTIQLNAAIYYVSSAGSDSNNGTSTATSWQTLAKVNATTFAVGDQILFNRGDEWEGILTVTTSGTLGNPITYGAYGTGNKPKIYGSTEITGWTNYSGNIYQATVSSDINQLFINGTRERLARYPNTGYFNVTSVTNSTVFTSTGLTSQASNYYSGATLMGKFSDYTMEAIAVTSSTSQTLTIGSSSGYGVAVNEGFFLSNKLVFLDQASEWYYDSSTNTVYLWTPNGDSPSNYVVRGSTVNYGINISSKDYITISNLEILHNGITSVHLDNAKHITVDQCQLTNPEQWGINTVNNGGSQYLVATSNYIYGANASGIKSFAATTTISDNDIINTGLFYDLGKEAAGQNVGTAIYTRAANSTITYNRIVNAGYDGINFWGTNTIVDYNYINGACQVLDDGGGIYTYNVNSSSAGSKVRYNIILNVFGNRDGSPHNYDSGFGIYMDNETTDIEISNNLTAHNTVGIFLHVAGNILVNNNILFDNIVNIQVSSRLSNSTITNNVAYATNRIGSYVWWTNTHQRMIVQDIAATYNNNKYISHYMIEDIFGSSYNFSEWKSATGQDVNSTCDVTTLGAGIYENLFYNETTSNKTFTLGTAYTDIDGASVTGSLILAPFTSKILLGDVYNFDTPDTTSPTVTSFTIPSTSTSLTISITTFTAMDDVGVIGYLLTESSTTPSLSDVGWSVTPQTNYTFASVGEKTLYAWAKDQAGNISTLISDNILISPPVIITKGISAGGNNLWGKNGIVYGVE